MSATFTTQPVVVVCIKGEMDNSPLRDGEPNLPRCRDDKGLILKFYKFLRKMNIRSTTPLGMGTTAGDGTFTGFFSAGDVEKIKTWLTEQGAERE